MMACDSEIEGGCATTYTYSNARAGAGSYVGRRNPAPRCLLPCPLRSRRGYIFSSFHSAKTLLMTHLFIPLKIKQISKTDIPSFVENRRIWNRRFCRKHNDSISSASFVAIGRLNIMFAPLSFFI